MVCACGAPTQLRTSWKTQNPGRRFRRCNKPSSCGFVAWVEAPTILNIDGYPLYYNFTVVSFMIVVNRLNNRKAILARVAAAKDIRAASSGGDRQGGSGTDPDPDEFFDPTPSQGVRYEPGQIVGLRDGEGEEIGKGCLQQARGSWCGTNLDEYGLCVVDVTYLKVDKWSNLPHPCDATGTSFAHSEQITGVKRVLWDSSKHVPQPKSR
ncbi:putative transcription factor GRF family [Helianthus annuus]|nr:putative transcription factor GRF family [Helianthus annuus]